MRRVGVGPGVNMDSHSCSKKAAMLGVCGLEVVVGVFVAMFAWELFSPFLYPAIWLPGEKNSCGNMCCETAIACM
jgi:hypothetical protein